MRVVIQRVSEAGVVVGGRKVSSIGPGLLVLAAFKTDDGEEELSWMARKCLELRIFEDGEGKMNRSLLEEGGELLVVSQFTLYGNCRKGGDPPIRIALRQGKRNASTEYFSKSCGRSTIGWPRGYLGPK